MAKFERGDVVRVCLNPTAGRETQGDFRPALVLSSAEVNDLGTAFIAPITQGGDFARFAGFAVSLTATGMETQGVVLVNMLRAVDLVARGAKKIEVAPAYVVEDALARLQAVFE
ncbi:type II toxin-antitoxin system ChpB family toxin [Candidatus Methylopumilus turicensis]|uniref:Toxin of the ChpB-ChpS toxin-antitoxin system n=1 Tax=Candidatus Methylopumilus turicensis TaxID=1581680 RepID=A0A0B7IUJ0_9PROT|nr:type II toxin-antitoxin system ChpB family toxin [Candidatus Methylopumilus turicensis]CEN55975.1 toxin of the ChpB-ChpS toxin-antitoxin system [Candidatus Methylopumilus turicensis]